MPTSLLPPHVMVKHTHTHADAQMSTAGGTFFKMSEEDKEWWKALRSNKRKVALVEWELFGPVKEKVMKHSSRSNVKLNQRICGRPKRQTQNIKNGGLWHGQPTGPQRDYKYSHITWLISMKRLAVFSPTNRLWQVCRGVCVSCRQWDMLRWLWCSDTATPHGPTELPSGAHVGTTASSIHSWSARQHSQYRGGIRCTVHRINLSLQNIKHRGSVHSIGCKL